MGTNINDREQALKMFEEIRTSFPHLKMALKTNAASGEIEMDILKQPGMDFAVNLSLCEDELHLMVGRHLWVEWFPCTNPEKSKEYLDSVKGLVSGRYRIHERFIFKKLRVDSALERPENGKWINITGMTNLIPWLIPWPRTAEYLQNGSTGPSV